jgi:hypothetical protein
MINDLGYAPAPDSKGSRVIPTVPRLGIKEAGVRLI